MKYLLTLIFITFSLSIFSQEIVGHIVTKKGKKINLYKNSDNKVKGRMYHVLYGDMNLTGEYVRYYDENNNLKKISQSKVEQLVYGEKKYMTLPIKKKVKRIHEVIAENDNYFLTEYYSYGGFYFYVFDKTDLLKPEVEKIQHSLFKEQDLKIIKTVESHFPNCKILIETLNKNIENAKANERKTSIGVVSAYEEVKTEKGLVIPNRILSQGTLNLKCN
jgi:hypothetical protein